MWEYVIMLFILALVGYLIFQPLMNPRRLEPLPAQGKEEKENALQRKKEEIYAAIKEMEFDFGMGKMSRENYMELRSQYKSRALEILKELDDMDRGDEADSAIEKEIQRLRRKKGPMEGKGKEMDGQINYCPRCGTKVDQNQSFCQGCGMKLLIP